MEDLVAISSKNKQINKVIDILISDKNNNYKDDTINFKFSCIYTYKKRTSSFFFSFFLVHSFSVLPDILASF